MTDCKLYSVKEHEKKESVIDRKAFNFSEMSEQETGNTP